MSAAWSIVVPTFKRPERLAALLDALSALEVPEGGFEAVIVDDGGGIDLRPVVRADTRAYPVRLIVQDNTGPAGARNRGAEAAHGTFIALTDDDCAPTPGWLTAFDACMKAHGDVLLGGVTENGLPDNPFSQASQDLVRLFEAWEARGGSEAFFASNNIAMRRESFHAVGGFDTSFPLAAGEDRAFSTAFKASGRDLVRCKRARLAHFHDLSLKSFYRQHSNYGRGAALIYADGPRPSVPDRLHFIGQLITDAFSHKNPLHGCAHLGLYGLSQMATTLGYLNARRGGAV